MEPRTSELGDASAAARGSQSYEVSWEEALEELADTRRPWREDDGLALQLVVALQLRELIHSIRPLLKHPLLRR